MEVHRQMYLKNKWGMHEARIRFPAVFKTYFEKQINTIGEHRSKPRLFGYF